MLGQPRWCKHYAKTPQCYIISTHLPILCRTFGNKTRVRTDEHTRPQNCALSAAYAPCAKKPPRVRLQLFELHSEGMFSRNAPHWDSPCKQLAALLKVCRYSTGYLDLFRRLVLKHNLKFRELNLFRPSGETVERHPTQIHSLEKFVPVAYPQNRFSFWRHSSIFHAPHYHSLFCLILLQTTHVFAQQRRGGRTKRATKEYRPEASATSTVEFCG